MDFKEIERYILAGASHSVCVHAVEVDEAPGCLRTITIHRADDAIRGGMVTPVTIEFEDCEAYVDQDFEGGGLKYCGVYPSLEKAVDDLEEFLGMPVSQWHNFTREPLEPRFATQSNWEANLAYFEDLVRSNAVELPKGAGYRIQGAHWRHIAKYGRFRPDKVFEEQEEELSVSRFS